MKNLTLTLLLITTIISCKKADAQKNAKIKNDNNMETSTQNIEFSDLFNEGTIIRFTPSDIENPKNEDEKEFKRKLQLFEKQHTIVEDFEPDDIKLLINDETFFEAKSYINKEWFDYFLNRYDLFYEFNELVELAIEQEDLNAINVLINHKYIFSIKDLKKANQTKDEQKDKLQRNKDEEFDFYELKYSRIDVILKLVTQKYKSNKIFDKDGYTNLRVGKSSNSSVLAKINSGEHIDVLDNPDEEDWYLVKTKEGKKGYVHKSRIKSE